VGGLSGGIRERKRKPASLRRATLNKASLGGENLNRLPLGRENSNKIMRAGGTFEKQGFLWATLSGLAWFKNSTS
jgi:hypothetical protein